MLFVRPMQNQEVTLENIEKLFDRRFEENFERKFEEKFEQKFEQKFEEKFTSKFSPLRAELDYIHKRINEGFDDISEQIAKITDIDSRIGFIERLLRIMKQALKDFV